MADPTSKPDCQEALHEVYHLLSGELTDDKRGKIQAHLDECPPCAEPYDFYAELRRVVQAKCHEQAPADLLRRIEEAISHEPH